MSIERDGRRFLLICDECGEQHVELDFNLAVEFKRERKNGWRAVRSGEGWADLCPDCAAGSAAQIAITARGGTARNAAGAAVRVGAGVHTGPLFGDDAQQTGGAVWTPPHTEGTNDQDKF
jgi:hypothetical protein